MKIAYLINGLDGGGAALPVADVAAVMRSRGHTVEVIAFMPKDGKACARLDQAAIPYHIIGDGPGDYLGPAQRLFRLLRQKRSDLLWTSLTRATLYGQFAGALLGIPVVSWQHNAFLKPANIRLLRATRRLTLRWVADSETVAAFARDTLVLPPKRIDIWPLFQADPDRPVARPWQGSEPFRVGSLGRLHRNKGYDVLIAAAALVRARDPALAARLRLEVAGEGPERAALEAAAAASGVSIDFVGFRADAASFLAGLHAYVQPSRHEGLCIAAHEAMQAGLPVIATPVGEMPLSLVESETGLLCPVGDAPALADAIMTLARDPARASAMGAASRQRIIERFSADRFRKSGNAVLQAVEQAMARL
jgi:glycosyltransferase involved in cell wall biosynthesis